MTEVYKTLETTVYGTQLEVKSIKCTERVQDVDWHFPGVSTVEKIAKYLEQGYEVDKAKIQGGVLFWTEKLAPPPGTTWPTWREMQ